MTRRLHILSETDTYKPSQGWNGFTMVDDKHRTRNSFLDNADLHLGVLSSVRKDTQTPWLELTVVETTTDKNGRYRPKRIYFVLCEAEMIALRDTINATLAQVGK